MIRGNWTDLECFYVDAVDGNKCVLLAGPFQSKDEAQGYVDRSMKLAMEIDRKAIFYAYGCSKWKNGYREGRFNKELNI